MPVLTGAQRAKIRAAFTAAGHCPATVTKPDILAAFNALDDWLDGGGAVLINAELPQPFKGQATVAQKAILLAYIALERAGE